MLSSAYNNGRFRFWHDHTGSPDGLLLHPISQGQQSNLLALQPGVAANNHGALDAMARRPSPNAPVWPRAVRERTA